MKESHFCMEFVDKKPSKIFLKSKKKRICGYQSTLKINLELFSEPQVSSLE